MASDAQGQLEKELSAMFSALHLKLGQLLDAVGMALRHQWCKERPSHLSDDQGSIRRSGPAKGHERVEEPAPTHLRQD